jgi:dCTP deaminase
MKMKNGILSGPEILKYVESGRIRVTPFQRKHLNPASLDLTLGDKVAVYEDFTYCGAADFDLGEVDGQGLIPHAKGILDVRDKPRAREWKIDPVVGWVILPGIGYLMHTTETVWAQDTVPIVDGKSSLGRLFLQVHMTAGYGDAGFDGQYTLEVKSTFPIRIYPGMRICQIRFVSIQGDIVGYEGHYLGDKAQGPVASRVWEQMEESQT